MENTIVKELPNEVQSHLDAIVESEFDLDIRVFTLASDEKEPQAFFTAWSCSCITCNGQINTCFTCVCN